MIVAHASDALTSHWSSRFGASLVTGRWRWLWAVASTGKASLGPSETEAESVGSAQKSGPGLRTPTWNQSQLVVWQALHPAEKNATSLLYSESSCSRHFRFSFAGLRRRKRLRVCVIQEGGSICLFTQRMLILLSNPDLSEIFIFYANTTIHLRGVQPALKQIKQKN